MPTMRPPKIVKPGARQQHLDRVREEFARVLEQVEQARAEEPRR